MSNLKHNEPTAQKYPVPLSGLVSSLVDFVCYVIVASPVVLLKYVTSPYNRGFFCDDQSIALPYKDGTVSTAAVALIGLLVPTFTVITVEAVHYATNRPQYQEDSRSTCIGRLRSNTLIRSVVRVYGVFLFGAIATLLLTDIGKYSLGVLRPHFLAVCRPDWTQLNCSDGYMTKALCTGDQDLIRDARLSFPSRQASFSAFTMGFVVLYIEANVTVPWSKFLKPTIQLVAVVLALFCGFSRIFDNMHHWSDVLAGFALGALLAFACTRCITTRICEPRLPRESEKQHDKEVSIPDIENNLTKDSKHSAANLGCQVSDLELNAQLNTHF